MMNREEAIKIIQVRQKEIDEDIFILTEYRKRTHEALDMAIEALQFAKHFDLLKEYQSLQKVVQCKDCRHAVECNKSVQYTRNEPNSVTIGYSQIEWCSRGERKEE